MDGICDGPVIPDMTQYPRAVRDAQIKCLACNAPATRTVDGGLVCVDCGRQLMSS